MSLLDALLLEPHRLDVWIAKRTDGIKGCGTQSDPYNANTDEDAGRFDTVMSALPGGTPLRVHLGPGEYLTRGYADGVSGGWQVKSGMKLIGWGIDVTTLRLAQATTGSRHYWVVGHALSEGSPPVGNALDFVEILEMTIHCDLVNQTGSQIACGAVRLMGNHCRVQRVKAVGWGSKTSGPTCRVFAMITADPASGISGVVNLGIVECLAVQGESSSVNVGPIVGLHVGGLEAGSTHVEAFGQAPFIRDCYVDGEGVPSGTEVRGLSMGWCARGVVEGNRIFNCRIGGPFQEQSSTREIVVRDNTYKNVEKGPYWQLGTLSPNVLTGAQTADLDRIGSDATITMPTGVEHFLEVGDRVQISGSPNDFDGIHEITAKQDETFTFKTSVISQGEAVISSIKKVFGVERVLVEGNTLEISTATSGDIIGIHVDDASIGGKDPVYPAYPHGEVMVLSNRFRYVDGAFQTSPPFVGYALRVNGAERLQVRDNVVESVQTNPLRNERSGSVRYFNNQKPDGTLIRGFKDDTDQRYNELETDAEDALILALFNRR